MTAIPKALAETSLQWVLFVGRTQTSLSSAVSMLKCRGWRVETIPSMADLGSRGAQVPGPRSIVLETDGLDTAPAVERTRIWYPTARIVVVAQFPCLRTAVKAIRSGADEFVCLPVAHAELVSLLTGDPRPLARAELESLPSLDRVEWEYITRVLAYTDGNISGAARIMGIQRSTLQRRLKKMPVSR